MKKFVAVAANDKCVASLLLFWSHDLQGFLILLSSTALAMMRRPLMITSILILMMMMECKLPPLYFTLLFSYLCIYSAEITPPPTPSPVKATGGKKRAVADYESDENDVFVPR